MLVSSTKALQLWDGIQTETQRTVWRIPLDGKDNMYCVEQLSESTFVGGSWYGKVRIFDTNLPPKRCESSFQAYNSQRVCEVAPLANRRLATRSQQEVKIWDLNQTAKPLLRWEARGSWQPMCAVANGSTLVTGERRKLVSWDLESEKRSEYNVININRLGEISAICQLGASEERATVFAVGTTDGGVSLWDTRISATASSPSCLSRPIAEPRACRGVPWHPIAAIVECDSSPLLAIGQSYQPIRIVDVRNMNKAAEIQKIPAAKEAIMYSNQLAWLHGGRHLVRCLGSSLLLLGFEEGTYPPTSLYMSAESGHSV